MQFIIVGPLHGREIFGFNLDDGQIRLRIGSDDLGWKQVQERLTVQIAETIRDAIQPRGVGVVIEAVHFCMMMRGVEKQNAVAVTSCMLGSFRDRQPTREEFLELIRRPARSAI